LKNFTAKILFFIFSPLTLLSQNWIHYYYETTTHNSFRNNKLFYEAIDFARIDYPRLNAAIFFVTNEERVKNNLPPVEFNRILENAASDYSKRMVRLNFFDHFDPYNELLKSPTERLRFAGISNPYAAENIATPFAIKYNEGVSIYPIDEKSDYFSYMPNGPAIPNHTYISLAEFVVDLWMHSEGHRANILNPNALQMGCGTFFYREKNRIPKFMAVQNFQLYEMIKEEE